MQPILKAPKNAISKFWKKMKKCMYVDIMLILICADFGPKNDHM
jgi:hypothetical protein